MCGFVLFPFWCAFGCGCWFFSCFGGGRCLFFVCVCVRALLSLFCMSMVLYGVFLVVDMYVLVVLLLLVSFCCLCGWVRV